MSLPDNDYRNDPRLPERFEQLWNDRELCQTNLSKKSQEWAKLAADNSVVKERAQALGWVWAEESTVVDAVDFLINYYTE